MVQHSTAGASSADPDLLATPQRAAQLAAEAAGLPNWTVTEAQRADLDLLVTGGYAPVTRFHTQEEARSIETEGRLPDATPWPAPLTLSVPTDVARAAEAAGHLVLRDQEGTLLAVLVVTDHWDGGEASHLAGSPEPVRSSARWDFADLRRPVAAIRDEVAAAGRSAVLAALPAAAAVDARTVRRWERAAAALDAVLLVLVAAGADPDHLDVHRIRGLRRVVDHLPAGTLLRLFPSVRDVATDPTAAGLHAVVARNAGATHLLLGSGTPDAAEVTRLGLVPVDPDDHAADGDPPAGQLQPEVAAALAGGDPPRSHRGFAILLTGLSGSGKSTVAKVLRARLVEADRRRVTLLDGDLVRRHLSSELGFSREHRDLNVRRIGYVASEVAKHGGIAICCPIAPYDRTRGEVRAMVEATGGGFVLVHVATPLEVCEARDVKGLYARARAGELTGFTGVDDPYEPPDDAEVAVNMADQSPAEAADRILAHLATEGWLDPA